MLSLVLFLVPLLFDFFWLSQMLFGRFPTIFLAGEITVVPGGFFPNTFPRRRVEPIRTIFCFTEFLFPTIFWFSFRFLFCECTQRSVPTIWL